MPGMLRAMSRWWLTVPVVLVAPMLAVAVGGSTGVQAIYLHIATNEPTSFVVQDIDDLDIGHQHGVYIAWIPTRSRFTARVGSGWPRCRWMC